MIKQLATALLVTGCLCAAAYGEDNAPIDTPEGMAWIPPGEFRMGTQDPNFTDAQPIHTVRLDGFFIDKTEVTNAQFAEFVKATGYVTVAERTPKAQDFPDVPKENLVAGSIVFRPPSKAVPLNNSYRWWAYVEGAQWRHPQGPGSDIAGRDSHPVVHIAYEDAQAYANWAGKQLPTEAQWEYAARGGLDQNMYTWGNEFKPDDKYMANTFQGHFPDNNTADDGHTATAPVASFPPNGFGLYDTAGNVWEWTQDWYHPHTYQAYAQRTEPSTNPQGPLQSQSHDPAEPGVAKRVQKGGSFLCTDQYCTRYMPAGRGKGEPTSSTNHLGFRCVINVAPDKANNKSVNNR